MKNVTKDVINTLEKCEVNTIMATGDNVLTAISVAGQCGIINRNRQTFLADLQIDKQTNKPKVVWQTHQGQKDDLEKSNVVSEESKQLTTNELPWNYND